MQRKSDGMQTSSNQRTVFNRQPARLLLLDLQSCMDSQTISNLCDAMENIFSLVTSLNGPNRIPFVGLMLLHNYPEVIFPLQPLRGNFPRLISALNDLRRSQKQCNLSPDVATSIMGEAIKEGLAMFRRQIQGLMQTAGYWAQLELTFFTSQDVTKVTKTLTSISKQLDLDGLKKMQVVSLRGDDLIGLSERPLIIPSQSSDTSDTSSNNIEDDISIVDSSTIDNSVLCMENYLMSWLHDAGTDQEHLHITFSGELPPPAAMQGVGDSQGEGLTLKCDLQERILNPTNIPFSNCFFLGLEGAPGKPQPSSRAATHTLPISKLRVIHKLPADAVCEAVVYGMPLVVKATSCWKIDWEELEINQQHFLALCQKLSQKSEVLLAELVLEQVSQQSGFRYATQPRPAGLFLLMPSQRGSLLVKSIAHRELVMPLGLTGLDQPTDISLNHVQQVLDKVTTLESYNPLLTTSGLHTSLIAQLTKSMVGAQPRLQVGPNKSTKVYPTKPVQERKPMLAGPPIASKTTFTSARWAMERSQDNRASSGSEFYSKHMDGPDGFPTQL